MCATDEITLVMVSSFLLGFLVNYFLEGFLSEVGGIYRWSCYYDQNIRI